MSQSPQTRGEPSLSCVTVKASNGVRIEWAMSDVEPKKFSHSYPAEWSDERHVDSNVLPEEEIESRISEAIEETREFVLGEFY